MSDSTSESVTPAPRKRPRILRWFALAAVVFVAWFLWQLFGPTPPIVVSKQTTYITAPLRPDGLPDYRKYLDDKLRESVTRDNNDAVLMWQVLGPGEAGSAIDPREWKSLAEYLQIPPTDVKSHLHEPTMGKTAKLVGDWLFINSPEWRRAQAGPPGSDSPLSTPVELGDDAIWAAMDAPWKRKQLPPLAEWIDANNSQIDLLVEASMRPRFYTPLPPAKNGQQMALFGMSVDYIHPTRAVARIISTRAMLHIGEGRHQEAWRDLHAIHKWARLVSQGSTILDQRVAIAINGIACEDDTALLGDPTLPEPIARQILHDLLALKSTSNVVESLDCGERIFRLNSIVAASRNGIGAFYADNFSWKLASGETDMPAWKIKLLNLLAFDWSSCLFEANCHVDQVVEAAKLSNHEESRTKIEQLNKRFYGREIGPRSLRTLVGMMASANVRKELLGTAVAAVMCSNFPLALEAQDTDKTRVALLRIAAALAVYRAAEWQLPRPARRPRPKRVAEAARRPLSPTAVPLSTRRQRLPPVQRRRKRHGRRWEPRTMEHIRRPPSIRPTRTGNRRRPPTNPRRRRRHCHPPPPPALQAPRAASEPMSVRAAPSPSRFPGRRGSVRVGLYRTRAAPGISHNPHNRPSKPTHSTVRGSSLSWRFPKCRR